MAWHVLAGTLPSTPCLDCTTELDMELSVLNAVRYRIARHRKYCNQPSGHNITASLSAALGNGFKKSKSLVIDLPSIVPENMLFTF